MYICEFVSNKVCGGFVQYALSANVTSAKINYCIPQSELIYSFLSFIFINFIINFKYNFVLERTNYFRT